MSDDERWYDSVPGCWCGCELLLFGIAGYVAACRFLLGERWWIAAIIGVVIAAVLFAVWKLASRRK